MDKFFDSTLLSNIIGFVSLIISFVSLYISKKTLKTADEIKSDIRNSQIKVLDHRRFNEERSAITKELQKFLEILSSKSSLSYKNAKKIYADICSMTNYSTIFSPADLKHLRKLQDKQKEICKKTEDKDHIPPTDYISVITDVIGIISKGEYDI